MNMNSVINKIGSTGMILIQVIPIGYIILHIFGFNNTTRSSGWISTNDNCKFFTTTNVENRDFTWNGLCQDGYAHGEGDLLLLERGRPIIKYKGMLAKGKMTGKGRLMILSDGDVYEGQFKDNRLHGYGHYYNDDGDHYEGYYINGKISGIGTYWYPPEDNKFKFVGRLDQNLEDGEGILYYRNGKEEEGFFKNGKLLESKPIENLSTDNPFQNVLITNDDGVEDLDRLVCLAEAISDVADKVVIVAGNQNMSGTSNSMTVTRQGYLDAALLSVDTVRQIYTYSVDGYPSDCVFLGSLGIFREMGEEVDLVISGINGGANEGVQWYGSGTIGAARTAALGGIPAIAVSGIDEDHYDQTKLKKLCAWIADLIQSPIPRNLKKHEYLTVSIPHSLEDIQGIKILPRAITFDNSPFTLEKTEVTDKGPNDPVRWKLNPSDPAKAYNMPAENDVYYHYNNYIVIVPMSVNENNMERLADFQLLENKVPEF